MIKLSIAFGLMRSLLFLPGNYAMNTAHSAFPYINPRLICSQAFRCQFVHFSGATIDDLVRACRAVAVEEFAQYGVNGTFCWSAKALGDSVYAPDDLVSMRRAIGQSAENEKLTETGIEHAIPVTFGCIVDTLQANTSMI